VAVITGLLEQHGQSGGCGHEHRGFTCHNSFIVADGAGAYVLETAGRLWAVQKVGSGARSISNGLTIEPFATEHSDRL
jgi:secernin